MTHSRFFAAIGTIWLAPHIVEEFALIVGVGFSLASVFFATKGER